MTGNHHGDAVQQAAQAVPPVSIGGAILAGVDLNNIVLALSAVFIICQIVYLLWRWHRDYKQAERDDRRLEDKGHDPERRKRGR